MILRVVNRAVAAIALASASVSASASAQAQPPPAITERLVAGVHAIPTPIQNDAIPLLATESAGASGEQWEQSASGERSIRNVSDPTLTPFLPDPTKATGVAVIVAPGGAFYFLGIDGEGYRVARWLTDHGVAAFVLKYRVEPTPRDLNAYAVVLAKRLMAGARGEAIETPAPALEDAKAAVRLVRLRAAEWGVAPNRVGFLGFSAGAITALSVGLADDRASRPDFIAPIYGPMSARAVPADAPPMFAAIALDDPFFANGKSLGLIDSWRTAGRSVEAHLYDHGGHGFVGGKTPATKLWIDEFYAWMASQGLVTAQR